MTGACLDGADLAGAALDHAVLDGIRFDSGTRWPDRFAPPPRVALAALKAADKPPGFRRAVTRRIGHPGPRTLRLWSVQTPDVWERLQRERVLYADPDCIDPHRRDAFDWMREQMARRVPGYTGGYPWWAFYQQKPDLRKWGWPGRSRSPGRLQVRLQLAVPAEQVLLSDFDTWGHVLNENLLSRSEGEADAWDDELRMSGIHQPGNTLPEPWNGWMRRSWEQIFDFEALAASEWGYRVDWVQATFERLELAFVVGVTEFMVRKEVR